MNPSVDELRGISHRVDAAVRIEKVYVARPTSVERHRMAEVPISDLYLHACRRTVLEVGHHSDQAFV